MPKCVAGRTNPKLWASSKRKAVAKLNGRFSARAMQLAAKLYKDAGGRYCGPKTKAQKSMRKWTKEKWQTAPGASKVACRKRGKKVTCDRYLPESAWKKLTAKERKATREKKKRGSSQWVSNTGAAKKAGRAARKKVKP